MCITAVAIDSHETYPFVMVFNRDETFERPTESMHEWTEEMEGIIAGKDAYGGGTWLGVSKGGNYSCVTNFWEGGDLQAEFYSCPSQPIGNSEGYLTRGVLPLRVLKASSVESELSQIWENKHRYKSFNMLAGNVKGEHFYFSVNRKTQCDGVQRLNSGIHCVSNIELNGYWTKIQEMRKNLENFLASNPIFEPQELFCLLEDNRKFGFVRENTDTESSIFVPPYKKTVFGDLSTIATVSSTVITLDKNSTMNVIEKTWEKDHTNYSVKEFSFQVPN